MRRKDVSQTSTPFLLPPTTSTVSEQEREISVLSTTNSEVSNQRLPFPSQIPTPHLSGAENGASILWEDLELMRHFVTETYLTFSCIDSIQDLWRTTLPKMASDYPFMMHGLLNISALHLAFLNPAKRDLYLASAIRHHEIFLSLYRSQLHSITPDNCSAVFISSSLISICTLAFPICSNNSSPSMPSCFSSRQQKQQFESPIQLASSLFTLLEGSLTLVRNSWQWLEDSPISALVTNRFQSSEVESNAKIGLHSFDSAFFLLKTRIESMSSRSNPSSSTSPAQPSHSTRYISPYPLSYKELSAYNNAISTLRGAFIILSSSEADNGIVLIWPYLLDVEQDFGTLLKEMRPLALVILAHYGVALHISRDDWFIGELGRKLVLDVNKTLSLAGVEAELQELMTWPLEMVSTGEELDGSDVNG